MRELGPLNRSKSAQAVVRWWRITPGFPTNDVLGLLGNDEQCKAASFKFEADRQAYIAGHGLLRLVAAQAFDARMFRLCYAAGGKPEIIGADVEGLDVSISHARGFAAVGLIRDGRIGVDVEARYRNDLLEDIASQAFSTAERAELARAPHAERPDRFLTIWTLKESVLKATGQGLSAPLQSFTVCPDPVGLMTAPDGSNPLNWRLHSTAVDGGWLAVALKLESNVEAVIDVKEYKNRVY